MLAAAANLVYGATNETFSLFLDVDRCLCCFALSGHLRYYGGSLRTEMAPCLQSAFCAAFELGAGFATTFKGFLALRSFFGIAMGGIWGLASSTALENLPVELRGLASGVLQVGYPFGCIIAAVITLYVVPHSSHTWRALFWTSAGLSAFAALVRALVPESEVFLRAKALERENSFTTASGNKSRWFIRQASAMLEKHWLLCIYAVLLMTGT